MTINELLTEEQLVDLGAQFIDFDNPPRRYAVMDRDGLFIAYKQRGDIYAVHASSEHQRQPHRKKERRYLQL